MAQLRSQLDAGGLGEVSLRGKGGGRGRGNVPVVMERDLARTLRGKTVVRRKSGQSLFFSRPKCRKIVE